MFKALLSAEDLIFSEIKCAVKRNSQYVAAEDLTDSYSEHEEGNAAFILIYIRKDKRNDNRIGKNGRQGSKEHALFAGFKYPFAVFSRMSEKISSYCSYKSCE